MLVLMFRLLCRAVGQARQHCSVFVRGQAVLMQLLQAVQASGAAFLQAGRSHPVRPGVFCLVAFPLVAVCTGRWLTCCAGSRLS